MDAFFEEAGDTVDLEEIALVVLIGSLECLMRGF